VERRPAGVGRLWLALRGGDAWKGRKGAGACCAPRGRKGNADGDPPVSEDGNDADSLRQTALKEDDDVLAKERNEK